MRSVKMSVHTGYLKTLYYSMIYPYLTFGIEVWDGAKKGLTDKICI